MRTLILWLCVFTGTVSVAQNGEKKITTVSVQTTAECGDCKERLENMLNYTKGVKYAELDLESKKVTVKFDTSKISLLEIKTKIAALGYDADDVKADEKAFKALPECCKINGMKH